MDALAGFKQFFKKNLILCVSGILALFSVFLHKPDIEYLDYVDLRTLGILFSLMVIMKGLQDLGLFAYIGEKTLKKTGSLRSLGLLCGLLCFFSSLLITNDVALITFVPFTIEILDMANRRDAMAVIIILETVCANLGSMLTPVGNPQNLYLFGLGEFSFGKFVMLILPYFLVSLLLFIISAFVIIKKDPLSGRSGHQALSPLQNEKGRIKTPVYFILFILALLCVLRLIPYYIVTAIVLITVLIMDAGVISRVDYSLLLTFVFLFIFIGNLRRVPAVSEFLSAIIGGREVISAVLASQVISNVPAAILLSGFTDNIRALIIGTDLGGLGTLIASMASLISYKLYSNEKEADTRKYLLLFSIVNVVFLLILLGLYYLIGC